DRFAEHRDERQRQRLPVRTENDGRPQVRRLARKRSVDGLLGHDGVRRILLRPGAGKHKSGATVYNRDPSFMETAMRHRHTCVTLFLALLSITMSADQKAFLGRWNLTGTAPNSDRVYWLEVKEENGKLSAMFLNRGGSPVRIDDVRMEGDELILQMQGRGNTPGPMIRLRAD